MPNRNYESGRRFEYRIIRYLNSLGYYCMRAYASRGTVDIIAVPGPSHRRTLMIQAKHSKRSGVHIAAKEVEKLKAFQHHTRGLVVIIHNKGRDMMVRIPGRAYSTDIRAFMPLESAEISLAA